jgi:predicted MPP superfamily phosphohydrolase
MPILTFLHLSDLHYDRSKRSDLDIVLQALFDDLRFLSDTDSLAPDLILFSGDLVNAGRSHDDFLYAHEAFVVPLSNCLGLPLDNFFIVPGNHDIDRSVVKSFKGFVESGLRTQLSSTSAVNDFIDEVISGEAQDAAQLALLRLSHYMKYVDSCLKHSPRFSCPFVTVESLTIKNISISISCFNTAWRATGEPASQDYGKLLLGERSVDLAAPHAVDSELRLSVFHHPLSWLQERDALAVQARLYATFDLLLYGHVHHASPEITMTAYGSSALSQAGCLYQSRDYFNGYVFVSIDTETRQVTFKLRTYHDRSRRFGQADDVVPSGQISYALSSRASGNAEAAIEKVLRGIRPIVRMRANKHLAMITGIGEQQDIKDSFVCPPIRKFSHYREVVPRTDSSDVEQEVVDLLNDSKNYIIRGQRESGRTSLAHYLAVLVSEGVCDSRRVPVVIDFSHLRRGKSFVTRAVRRYFIDVETGPVDKQVPVENWLLILDNVDVDTAHGRSLLEEAGREFPGARQICFADERHPGVHSETGAHPADTVYETRFIGALPRRSIRELAARWSVRMGRDQDATYQAVMLQLNRGRLPRTGYMVSLLLWAIHRNRDHERINEAVLLENILEYLLDKADFTAALRREFDYRSKEITLQSIAAFLKERGGWCTINELLAHYLDFLRASGLVYNANEIIERLIRCGVLAQDGDAVHFKYRCFQEYFLAGKIAEDSALYERALEGPAYLKHAREIDLLSGKDRRRLDLLNKLHKKVLDYCPEPLRSVSASDFSEMKIDSSTLEVTRDFLMDIRNQKFTQEQIDDSLDGAEGKFSELVLSKDGAGRNVKVEQDFTKEAEYIVTLELYGRVIRNLEFIEVNEKKKHVDIFLNGWARFIAWYGNSWKPRLEKILSETETSDREITEHKEEIAEFVAKVVMPMVFLAILEGAVATAKLEPVLEAKIRDKAAEPASRFISLCMLLGLRSDSSAGLWKQMWEEQRENAYLGTLLFAKLSMYYMVTPMDKREKEGLERLISEIVVMDYRYPKRMKGHVISNLRKQRQRLRGGAADLAV